MSANTYGRQVVEALTNKSGGGVVAGDVVVIDTANNDAFTTSTAGGFLGTIGIAQETIANNAVGRILTAGYAALVNVNASVTRGNFGKTYTVAKQATDAGASRTAGAFCQFLTGGTTPDAHLFGIADASSSSSGVPQGTAFPGAPSTNDLFQRTNINNWIFAYDSTRWRTVHSIQIAVPYHASGSATYATQTAPVPYKGTYTLYLLTAEFSTQLAAGTSDATHFWTVALNWDAADTTRNSLASFDTKTDTASNYSYHTLALNAVLSTSAFAFDILATKSSTPPDLALGTTIINAQVIAT